MVFQAMIQLCFALMKGILVPQPACSWFAVLCWKDFLTPTSNATSSGRSVAICPTHSEHESLDWEVSKLKATGGWSASGNYFSYTCLVFLLPQTFTLVLSEI